MIKLIYGIKIPKQIAVELQKIEKYHTVVNKINSRYSFNPELIVSDNSNDEDGVVGFLYPFDPKYNIHNLDDTTMNTFTDDPNLRVAIGQLFETVLNFWKEYEIQHSDQEILLPEDLNFSWFYIY